MLRCRRMSWARCIVSVGSVARFRPALQEADWGGVYLGLSLLGRLLRVSSTVLGSRPSISCVINESTG